MDFITYAIVLIIVGILISAVFGIFLYKRFKMLGKKERISNSIIIAIFAFCLAFTLFMNTYLADTEELSKSSSVLFGFFISYFTAAIILLVQTAVGKAAEKEQKEELKIIKEEITTILNTMNVNLKNNNNETQSKLTDLQIKVTKLNNKEYSSESGKYRKKKIRNKYRLK